MDPIYRPLEVEKQKKEIRQGELLENVIEHRPVSSRMDNSQTNPITHARLLVLSGDCDLLWDYFTRFPSDAPEFFAAKVAKRGTLPYQLYHVKVCEMFDEDHIKETMADSTELRASEHQTSIRYYQIPESIIADTTTVVPAGYLDFKKAFGIPPEALYDGIQADAIRRVAILQHPYVTDVLTRQSFFEGRVALPDRD